MNKLFVLIPVLLAELTFSACDKVESPYTEGPPIDTTSCPVPEFPDDTDHQKVVLIEEYTGHACVNCPVAAMTAHEIIHNNPGKAILLTIHAGYFAETEPGNYSLDLNSATGTDLHAFIGIQDNPAATFNRKFIGGNRIFLAPTSWESTFVDVQDTTPVLDMQMITQYNASENKVCVHVQTEYLVNLSANLKIAIYVAEDSIVGYQKNNDAIAGPIPEIPDYVFMHVLRGAVNGTWGAALSNTLTTAGTKKVSSYSYALNPAWVPKHCHLVAIVYNADTDEILQAVEAPVIP